METWLIGVIAGGAGLLLLLIVIGVARARSRKKKNEKAKAVAAAKAKAEAEAAAAAKPKDEFNISFSAAKPVEEKPHTEGVKVEDYQDDDYDDEDDDEFDAELDEEVRRYREMMMQRMGHEAQPKKPRQLTDDEEFEQFRNEHCYSKFFRDKNLAEQMLNLPDEVKSIVFSNIFDRKDFDNINFGDKQ